MEPILLFDKMQLFLGVFLGVCILVVIAIMLDLWDGVYTARVTRQSIHSHKLRVTIAKMSEYWRFLLIGFLMDCLGVIFGCYSLPFVAVLFGAGLIAVETKSMIEHAGRRKSHMVEVPEIISSIIAAVDRKDAERIVEVLTGQKVAE